jgi:hypothetical protein
MSSGRLDLANNKLIVTAGDVGTWAGSTYTGLTGLLASGRNGSALPFWDGNGIVTTQTLASGGSYTTLAISTAGQAARSVFGGLSVDPPDVLVMYTYGGDANLDGKLNIDDYIRIDSGIASGLTGWANGDFNYDGKINIDDYTQFIDANIATQGTAFPASTTPVADGALGVASVPEPGGGVAILGGCIGLAVSARRGRRRAGKTLDNRRVFMKN